jgi:TRAP-type transport system small permease protein
LPSRFAWQLEWVSDLLGLACCLYFVWYGWQVTLTSYLTDAVSIKTLVTPEWWLLALLPMAFLVFAIEFVFRMHRLATAERAPRTEAISAS